MGFIILKIVVRHDDGFTGESVAEGVDGGALFASLGFGAGGVEGVGPVSFISRWHECHLIVR